MERFWKLRYSKSARRCGATRVSKSKCTKHTNVGTLLEVEMLKKRTPSWREAHFAVKMLKTPHAGTIFGKVSKTWRFCSSFKTLAGVGALEENLQRCMSRGRCNARDTWFRNVRKSGRWFPERGCILVHQIIGFAKMILRDWCSTSYDLASLFRGRRNTLDRWNGQITKSIGTRPSALHFFEGSLAELSRFWCCQVQLDDGWPESE